jgi:hypothetical protein
MTTPGWEVYAAYVVPVLFILCVTLLFWMRDPLPGNARRVAHVMWCPYHKRVTEVVFREALGRSGLVRLVDSCPLRRRGERCGDACALQPSSRAWKRHLARRLRTHPLH